jgi:PTS system mannose-specific IID component/fructoselysine and glucoselysine-specific PTS system IID component
MAIGGMVATLIGITTPLTFSEGTVVLQDILNGIVPMVLDLGAVMGMYYLIKRNVKTTWMLAICILGGIALSAFGLLA